MDIKAVITGDIVRSEQIDIGRRDLLIQVLRDAVENLQTASPMQMELFRGDSFQIVIEKPETSLKIATMIRANLKANTPSKSDLQWDARIAIGIGEIEYQGESVVTSDGEAFKYSGRALDALDKNRLTVVTRWAEVNDELGVGIAFVDDLVTDWSPNQAHMIYLSIGRGLVQSDISSLAGKSQQSVSKALAAAKESLLKNYLKRFETVISKHLEL